MRCKYCGKIAMPNNDVCMSCWDKGRRKFGRYMFMKRKVMYE